jgi:DNA replication protein DnaC
VELFAEIRREYQFGIGTIKGVARKLGVHRRVVRQALADAVPPPRGYVTRAKPTLTPVQEFIDRILESDRLAPRKQRHTARRIYDRLCRERPEAPVAASTVRKYVGGWKRAQGLSGQMVCVPQTYGWGQEAQVDWYEAVAILGDEEVTLQVFCVRSMASGAAFHRAYLEALLAAEVDERERHAIARRLKDAHLPRVKTLDEFDFSQASKVSATQIRELADGGYIARTEPVVLIGDCGTGKTHLLTALCVAACRQKRRVRFTTAAALVNELVEAKHAMQLARVLARWARYDVIAIDEVGYVPLADVGAELLFQIIADRTERAALILTTNLPFSEWTQVIPNARLCKAVLDRITDRAHIIDTGHESYRFRRTIEKRQKKG